MLLTVALVFVIIGEVFIVIALVIFILIYCNSHLITLLLGRQQPVDIEVASSRRRPIRAPKIRIESESPFTERGVDVQGSDTSQLKDAIYAEINKQFTRKETVDRNEQTEIAFGIERSTQTKEKAPVILSCTETTTLGYLELNEYISKKQAVTDNVFQKEDSLGSRVEDPLGLNLADDEVSLEKNHLHDETNSQEDEFRLDEDWTESDDEFHDALEVGQDKVGKEVYTTVSDFQEVNEHYDPYNIKEDNNITKTQPDVAFSLYDIVGEEQIADESDKKKNDTIYNPYGDNHIMVDEENELIDFEYHQNTVSNLYDTVDEEDLLQPEYEIEEKEIYDKNAYVPYLDKENHVHISSTYDDVAQSKEIVNQVEQKETSIQKGIASETSINEKEPQLILDELSETENVINESNETQTMTEQKTHPSSTSTNQDLFNLHETKISEHISSGNETEPKYAMHAHVKPTSSDEANGASESAISKNCPTGDLIDFSQGFE